MDLVLNERSFEPVAPSRPAAYGRIDTLVDVLVAASQRGVRGALRSTDDATERPLAQAVTLATWLNDRSVDAEKRRRLRSALSKAPYVEAALTQLEASSEATLDVYLGAALSRSATLAHRLDAPLVSCDVAPWDRDPLTARLETLEADTLVEQVLELCNLYSVDSVERRTPWLRERLQQELANGAELVQRARELLPRLDFVDAARAQLRALTGSERVFRFVLQHLFALNDRAAQWSHDEPSFTAGYRFRCSDESQATLAKYRAARTFMCPDGQARCFSMHSKVNVDAWRIHFIPDRAALRVLVGYVGPHLPTASG